MILSFFAFLLISFSIAFGLASFATGLHNEMPNEVLQNQKYETQFNINYQTWDSSKATPDNAQETSGYKDEIKGDFENEFEALLKDSNNEDIKIYLNKSNDKDYVFYKGEPVASVEDLVKEIINVNKDYRGSIQGALIAEEEINNNKNFSTSEVRKNVIKIYEQAEVSILKKWSNTNLAGYTLAKDVLPKYYPFMQIWDWNIAFKNSYGMNGTMPYWILNKDNEYQSTIKDSGVFQTKKYINENNVLILSPETENIFNYKLGEKVTINNSEIKKWNPDTKVTKQTFTYGGTGSFVPTLSDTHNNKEYKSYIINYSPEKDVDFRKAYSNQTNKFFIRDVDGKNDKNTQYERIYGIAKNYIVDADNGPLGWSKQSDIFNTYIVYIGMTMFSVIICILMVILDIIVAWFLIKEIIRSLSNELLFLKTLGMSNAEASMITSVTLFAIMIASWGLSLIGMLGIQALFIGITNKFLYEFNTWSVIRPFSWVIIFGVLIFLSAIYVLSTFVLLKKVDLTSSSVFNNSGNAFGKLRGFLFNKSVNSGLTFAFTMKNSKKIISTFFIAGLVTMLSFIALGFDTAVNKGINNMRNFINHKETASWNLADGWTNTSFKGDKPKEPYTFIKTIKYHYENVPKDEELNPEDAVKLLLNSNSDAQNKYITRNNFTKLLTLLSNSDEPNSSEIENVINKWNAFCNQYDENVLKMWPNADTNFKIVFGALYSNNSEKETSYQLNNYLQDNAYRKSRLIVVDDNSAMAKKLFKNQTLLSSSDQDKEPVINSVVGEKYLREMQTDDGDISDGKTNIDFHLFNNGNSWPDADAFHIKMNGSDLIEDSNEVYVKNSDFKELIKRFESKASVNDKDLFSKILKDYDDSSNYNTFLSNGLPLDLQQFSVPTLSSKTDLKTYLKTLLGLNQAKGSMENTFKNSQITYYKVEIDENQALLKPIQNAMVTILILIICLAVAFIIFMVMSIMSENDDIIFILKALGYQRYEILWRMIAGYMVAIWISVIAGIILAAIILGVMNGTFEQMIYMGINLGFSGPIAGLFFALFLGLPLFIIWISSYKIKMRNLTTIDRQ